jgi:DNA-binding response OmpR family regulator
MDEFKILIIDDEVATCKMLSDFFCDRGHEVIYALSGQGGLNAFYMEKPSCVMINLCLKDMSGLEVLKQIKAADPDCTIIVITGSDPNGYEKEVASLGVNYYICKPCSMNELRDLIERL